MHDLGLAKNSKNGDEVKSMPVHSMTMISGKAC